MQAPTRPMRGRGGLSSNNPVLSWLIKALDIGPATRPVAPWTKLLVILTVLGATLLVLDGVFTILVLEDPNHPFAIEANPITRTAMEVAGNPGLLLAKLAQALAFLGTIELSRRRGLPKTALVIGALGIVIGGLLVLNSLAILTSPPTLLY